jgi:hypothetical protein
LITTVDAWADGFRTLRLSELSAGRWMARPLDRKLDECFVDGTSRIAASYVCRRSASTSGGRSDVLANFRQIESRIDLCLAQPLWYPRQWSKARALDLSGGEQQQLWRDQHAWPRPALQLKIEEDYDHPGRWLIRLTTYTMR